MKRNNLHSPDNPLPATLEWHPASEMPKEPGIYLTRYNLHYPDGTIDAFYEIEMAYSEKMLAMMIENFETFNTTHWAKLV